MDLGTGSSGAHNILFISVAEPVDFRAALAGKKISAPAL
jgi:hypothetical protein